MIYTVTYKKHQDGFYANIPGHNCSTIGKTVDEARKNLKIALSMYLENEEDIDRVTFEEIVYDRE